MTVGEARKIVQEFDDGTRNPTEEDFFLFTEAMDFLINEEHNPRDMMYLGGVYYDMKRFDLALKYYEMAAAMDYDCAYEGLGYIWYYGRTGERDYKKAFEYFSKIAATGNVVAQYKIADMYRNGYYVEKNQEKYEEIIEKLYNDSKHWDIEGYDTSILPLPEIYTRLARIKRDKGLFAEAINLFLEAKNILADRIRYNAFFGNLNIMKWLIDDLYELMEFDEEYFDFFDLYYLLKTPHKITFMYADEMLHVESVMEGEECTVCYNGKWFVSRDDFFREAMVEGTNDKLTSVSNRLYGFEVVE